MNRDPSGAGLASFGALESHLERWQFWYLAGFTALYFGCAGFVASKRFLIGDELVTFYIARLAGASQIWQALLAGADYHPPLDFLIRHFSVHLFGQNELATRLPSLLGFWTLCVCLFRFVARRIGLVAGFVELLFPIGTGAYFYSYFGRSYSVELGCCGLALVAWQILGEPAAAGLIPALLLFLSLSMALSLHYYAVFLYVPIVAGEAIRVLQRRHVNWYTVSAMALALVSLVPLVAFMRVAALRIGHLRAAPVHLSAVVQAYVELLGNVPVIIVAVFFLTACYLFWCSFRNRVEVARDKGDSQAFELHLDEIVCAAMFLLFPVMLGLTGRFVTNAFTARYAVPTVVGFSILVGLLVRWSRGPAPFLGPAVFFVVASLAVYTLSRNAYGYQVDEQVAWNQQVTRLLRASDDPVVTDHPGRFLPFNHYCNPSFQRPLYFLLDTRASIRWTGEHEMGMQAFAALIPGRVKDYRSFIADHASFFVVSPSLWLVPQLLEDGARIEIVGVGGGVTVMRTYTRSQKDGNTL